MVAVMTAQPPLPWAPADARPVGAACDSGAYEGDGAEPTPTVTPNATPEPTITPVPW